MEVGSAGSYLGATEQLRRIATRVITSGEIITWGSPCGSNCSYTISFIGPAYRCQKLDSLPSNVNLTSSGGNPGQSPFVYVAEGRYRSSSATPSTVWLGDLDTQGLWVVRGIAPYENITRCQLFESTYTTNVQYSENIPFISTTVVYQNQIPGSAAQATQIGRSPLDLNQSQWSLINLFSIEEAVAGVLSGAVTISSVYGGYNFQNTLIARSNLAVLNPGIGNIAFPSDFEHVVEELLVNTTVSVNYFLANPPTSRIGGSNISMPVINTSTIATIVTYPPLYEFSVATLWEIYGSALAVSVVCIAVGCYMLAQNGVDAEIRHQCGGRSILSFSQVLVTTRNQSLDRQCQGAWMGGEYITKTLRDTELKFGEVQTGILFENGQARSETHAGFQLTE